MYIYNTETYYKGGSQCTKRAPFLIMMNSKDRNVREIRCIVRKVALEQSGHYMFGYANIGGKWIYVCGTYGDNGLPRTVPEDLFLKGTELPSELYEAWNKGGGWNGAGSEGTAMREFGRKLYETSSV